MEGNSKFDEDDAEMESDNGCTFGGLNPDPNGLLDYDSSSSEEGEIPCNGTSNKVSPPPLMSVHTRGGPPTRRPCDRGSSKAGRKSTVHRGQMRATLCTQTATARLRHQPAIANHVAGQSSQAALPLTRGRGARSRQQRTNGYP